MNCLQGVLGQNIMVHSRNGFQYDVRCKKHCSIEALASGTWPKQGVSRFRKPEMMVKTFVPSLTEMKWNGQSHLTFTSHLTSHFWYCILWKLNLQLTGQKVLPWRMKILTRFQTSFWKANLIIFPDNVYVGQTGVMQQFTRPSYILQSTDILQE